MSSRRFWRVVCSLLTLGSTTSALGQAADGSLAISESEVVSIAVAQNPSLQASMLELASTRWEIMSQEAGYAPVLQLEANAQRLAQPQLFQSSSQRRADVAAEVRKSLIWGTQLSLRFSGYYQLISFEQTGVNMMIPGSPVTQRGTFGPGYSLAGRLALKQPLLRGRGKELGEASILNARAQQTEAQHARDRAASEVLRDGLSAYWELWFSDRTLAIQRASREVAAKQRDEAKARVETGALAPVDVLTFETQVATREEDIVNAELTRRQRELELLAKLGIDEPPASLTVLAEGVPLVSLPSRESAERRVLEASPELRQLAAAVSRARLQDKTAADPQRARLDLDSYVQTQGLGNDDVGAAASQFGKFEVISAFVGLTYEGPLDGRAHRSAAAKARIAVEVAEQRLREARLRILSELGKALEGEATGERKLALSERTRDIAKRQLEAEQARYATGASTPIQVLDAEDKVRSAELRVARAQADLVQSALLRQHLTGDLLQRYASAASAAR
jgi:outer membrane protein TolC